MAGRGAENSCKMPRDVLSYPHCEVKNGQDQNDYTPRRDRRGRNDPRALAVGERHPHHSLRRPQDGILRSFSREPRRAEGGGVRAQKDVGEPQRDHPCQDGRHRVPRARHRPRHHASRPRVEEAHRHRPSRLRRRV